MDPLQSFAPPPRRPPISPKTKARNGVSRKVFALPVIHQFQPVLASSPRSYLAAGAGQKAAAEKAAHHSGQAEGGANGQDPELIGPAVNAGIASPSMVPRHPNRPKSREAMESPRVLHPQQPPAGISSRTDVDIYRYSQGTEQRMAIRPLFEQRRESGTGKHQPVSPKCSQQEAEREAGDTVENDDGVRREEDDRRSRGMWQRDERDADESKTGGEEIPQLDDSLARGLLRVYDTPNQEDRRPELPLDVDAPMRDNNDVHAVEEQDQYGSSIGYDRVGMAENAEKGTSLASPAEDTLMKPLDISCCHEPFLQTEGPKLDRLRNTVKVVSSEPTESSALVDNDPVPSGGVQKSGELVYKVMRKDQRTLGDRLVLVTVLLSSRGDVRITFKTVSQAAGVSADGDEEAIVVIADAELAQSKHLRPDLHVLTSEWAEWIITRVRCDVGDVFYLNLDDAQGSEKRRCFFEIVTVNGKELAVEMFVLTATNSLLVSSREIESNLSSGEVLLRPDEVRRLAASFGKLDKEQDVLALVEDYEFLVRIANDSNILRLGSDCAGFVGELDDSALGGHCGRLAKSPSIAENENAVASEPQLDDLGLLHPANGVQTILEGNKLVAAIAFLAQAYGENATLSALRQFQQKEAIQLYVTSVMLQAVRIDKESVFNDRVQQKMEATQKAKLQVNEQAHSLDESAIGC
ncbi:hypothetical protein BBJ28_00011073 [Nothophytophthora sp. Chile5]|nr:hypothetical protein BBJ28_00011073 [Nothophytophthora sp. Chile5]